jgi:hypothetical protein
MMKEPGYVWENLVRGNCNGDGCGKAYFIGYPNGLANDVFSHVLEVDLANLGIVVSDLDVGFPNDDGLGGIARDLLAMLHDDPESSDFTIITDHDIDDDDDSIMESSHPDSQIMDSSHPNSQLVLSDSDEKPSIQCHTLILLARWPHFKNIMNAKMSEFHTRKLILPEQYTVVRALVTFFYTDTLPFLDPPILARLLVLSNLYNMTRLRALCLGKLLRELTVEHATTVWAAAREADERGLERRAGKVCFENWGEVVRTRAFRGMKREDVLELCGLVGRGARVVDPSAAGSEVGSESEGEEDEGDAEDEVDEGDNTGDEEMDF